MDSLLISNFPNDVKSREIKNLLFNINGVLINTLELKRSDNLKDSNVYILISFNNNENAINAMHMYHNYQFDSDCHLRVELIERLSDSFNELSNSKIHADNENENRLAQHHNQSVFQTAPAKTSPFLGGQQAPLPTSNSPRLNHVNYSNNNSPEESKPFYNGINYAQQSDFQLQRSMLNLTVGTSSPISTMPPQHMHNIQSNSPSYNSQSAFTTISNQAYSPSNTYYSGQLANQNFPTGGSGGASNAPCSTLFAGNLGATTTERELQKLFETAPGFRRVRFTRKGTGPPVAFLEFDSEIASINALRVFQGHLLASCERGGIRLEFARTKMGSPAVKDLIIAVAATGRANYYSSKHQVPLSQSLLQRNHIHSQQLQQASNSVASMYYLRPDSPNTIQPINHQSVGGGLNNMSYNYRSTPPLNNNQHSPTSEMQIPSDLLQDNPEAKLSYYQSYDMNIISNSPYTNMYNSASLPLDPSSPYTPASNINPYSTGARFAANQYQSFNINNSPATSTNSGTRSN